MDILALFRDSKNPVSLAAGETLFEQGDAGDTMYVVIAGDLTVLLDGQNIDTLTPGDLVGEMSLVDGSPRSATVRARIDSELVPIDRDWFAIVVKREPNFALHVLSVAVGRVRRLMGASGSE
jgi:CRP-like cAMP-binding protein